MKKNYGLLPYGVTMRVSNFLYKRLRGATHDPYPAHRSKFKKVAMVVVNVPCMNGGGGETSYAKNSNIQVSICFRTY